MPTILKRAQIGRAAGIDTTVKSAVGLWRTVAPTWAMVLGWKRRSLSAADYRMRYWAILDRDRFCDGRDPASLPREADGMNADRSEQNRLATGRLNGLA